MLHEIEYSSVEVNFYSKCNNNNCVLRSNYCYGFMPISWINDKNKHEL